MSGGKEMSSMTTLATKNPPLPRHTG